MLIHPMPDPVAFALGPVKIHWYGLMYVLAFALFILLGRVRIRQPHIARQGWTNQHLDDMLFYGMLGVVLGGRLGEVLFYRPDYFFHNPLQIFAVWNGGMSFHGGFLGVLFAMWLWARKQGFNVLDVYDFIAPLVPLGYACGRMGNFINAELPGRVAPDTLPWAMIWPNVDALPRHPSPIYQMLIDGCSPARPGRGWRWARCSCCCMAARASSPNTSARPTGASTWPVSMCRRARCCRCR
jgi:phosphatidylglycerol:prolipoprotein diacylglycerol transferase